VTTNGRASDCVATGAFYRHNNFNDPESNYLMPETWAKMASGRLFRVHISKERAAADPHRSSIDHPYSMSSMIRW
jgi:hypothetical protein